MARVRILQHWNNHPVGAVVTIPGGEASVLIPRRIAELTTDPETAVGEAPKPKAPAKPKK